MKTVRDRLLSVREAMAADGVQALWVPSTDEHLNEYVPLHLRRREWLSGFTGSAGDLLVGTDCAWLFTDSRYHLQAESELADTGIELVRMGIPGAKPLSQEIASGLTRLGCDTLHYDPSTLPSATAVRLKEALNLRTLAFSPVDRDLVAAAWGDDRPAPASADLRPLDAALTGLDVQAKLESLRGETQAAGANGFVSIALDEIAWLLNLRTRGEVPFQPFFLARLLVTPTRCALFLEGGSERLPASWSERPEGLEVLPSGAFTKELAAAEGPILVDPSQVTSALIDTLEGASTLIVRKPSPLTRAKAIKSTAEAQAMRDANRLASLAKTRTYLWVDAHRQAGQPLSERAVREHIEAGYAALPGFAGLSFETICGGGPNGAVVHYRGIEDTPLPPEAILLLDSGAHYEGGTTDDTRTFALGRPPQAARRDYTLVLRSHAAGATARLRGRSPGVAVDAIVRAPLWAESEDFDHGTGHGVGAMLSVHEGPFGISPRPAASSAVPMQAGHITSIEPGLYRANARGTRLENLYLVTESQANSRAWMDFECLTWIPFDRQLIDDDALDPMTATWLATYHAQTLERLAPDLDTAERTHLEKLL